MVLKNRGNERVPVRPKSRHRCADEHAGQELVTGDGTKIEETDMT
jgi:hypothetical protein